MHVPFSVDVHYRVQAVYNTILESLLVWVRNPLGLFLSRSFLSYSIKPSPSGLRNTHQLLAFDYIPCLSF